MPMGSLLSHGDLAQDRYGVPDDRVRREGVGPVVGALPASPQVERVAGRYVGGEDLTLGVGRLTVRRVGPGDPPVIVRHRLDDRSERLPVDPALGGWTYVGRV